MNWLFFRKIFQKPNRFAPHAEDHYPTFSSIKDGTVTSAKNTLRKKKNGRESSLTG
jgi:hypothetical protein